MRLPAVMDEAETPDVPVGPALLAAIERCASVRDVCRAFRTEREESPLIPPYKSNRNAKVCNSLETLADVSGIAHKLSAICARTNEIVPIELLACCHCRAQIEQITVLRCFWCLAPMCNGCWELHYSQCVRCARTITAVFKVAKMALEPRTNSPRLGRKPIMRRCHLCGQPYSAREMRLHQRQVHPMGHAN